MRLLDSDIYKRDLKKALKNIDLSILSNKSVLITGGLGLIGTAIVDLLLVNNTVSRIYVLGRNETSFEEKYKGFNKVSFVSYDALKPLKINIEPDYVIYAAGIASPELYVEQPVETMMSNLFGIQEMLKYCKKKNVEKLLYVSSSEVYGRKDNELPFVEGTYGIINIDDIRSSYAIAKRSSELLCKSYYKEFGMQTVIVRPGHIYGPSASINDKRISSDFAYKAARGESLNMKSSGIQKRSYCYSIDCAVAILITLINGLPGDVYNIGHSEITTIRQMASILAKAGNVQLSVIEPTNGEKAFFNPMNNSTLNCEKIIGLGYKETFSVEEGLTHTVQILKQIQ